MRLRIGRMERDPTATMNSRDITTLEELYDHLEDMAESGFVAVEISLAPGLLQARGVSLLGLELSRDEAQSWTVIDKLTPSRRAG